MAENPIITEPSRAGSLGSSSSAHSLSDSEDDSGDLADGLHDGDRYDNLRRKLHQGRRALHRTRCFVGGVMVALGLASFLGHMACVVHFHFFGHSSSLLGVAEELTAGFLFALRDVALGLAPLPDDARLTRWVILAQVFMSVLAGLFSVYMAWRFLRMDMPDDGGGPTWCRFRWVRVGFDLVMMSLELPLTLRLVMAWRLPTAFKMQECMWGAIELYTVLRMLNYAWFLTYHKSVKGCVSGMVLMFPGLVLALLVSHRPWLRQRAQAGLGSCLKEHGTMAAAASIAGLIGECGTQDVLLQATLRFRTLPLQQLTREDLASNAPGLGMAERVASAALLECDAFVSHSWRDSPEAKWAALQAWRFDFLRRTGREPRIWFDKLCIDQTNIDADLRCLPIFLSSCREMLVLCGPTYLSRLWCVLEIFTFGHVVGDVGGISLKLVLRDGQEEEDRRAIRQAFREFDAEACQCSVRRDKDTILSVIRAAFGGLDGFNAEVQSILIRQEVLVRADNVRRPSIWARASKASDAVRSCLSGSSGRSCERLPSQPEPE